MDLRSKLLKLERRLSEAQKIILEQSQQIKKQSEEISRLQSILSQKIVKTTSSNSHLSEYLPIYALSTASRFF